MKIKKGGHVRRGLRPCGGIEKDSSDPGIFARAGELIMGGLTGGVNGTWKR